MERQPNLGRGRQVSRVVESGDSLPVAAKVTLIGDELHIRWRKH